MEEVTDFEALIDFNEIFPRVEENTETDKESSQEGLSDVLDKMCETIDAEGIAVGLNAVNSDEKQNEIDDTILNLDEFNKILNETRVLNENINNLENEETVLSSNAKTEQDDNNAVPYHSLANVDDIADILKNTAGEFDNEMRENEKVSEEADDIIINLDEFEDFLKNTRIPSLEKDIVQNTAGEFYNNERENENVSEKADDAMVNLIDDFFNNTRIANVDKDNLENKETTLSSDANNEVNYLPVTDFVGIANSCNIDTDEAYKKHKNKEDLDDTIINLDEFQDVPNGACTFKKTLLSKKLAKFEENEDMATLDYCSVPKLVKIEGQTKNTDTNKIISNDFEVPTFTSNLKEKENLIALKTNLNISDNSNKDDDKSDLKTILIEEDIEVISISSTEDVIDLDDSDTDDGYNSDDFEFISESEAKKQAPLTNLNVKEFKGKLSYSDMKYHKRNYIPCMDSARANRVHVIPEGESYFDLFRGMCVPIVMNNLYYMTNKHVLPVQSMSISNGFGFDIPEEREETPEHAAEATESLKKIRFLYPDENRKRRRRF